MFLTITKCPNPNCKGDAQQITNGKCDLNCSRCQKFKKFFLSKKKKN